MRKIKTSVILGCIGVFLLMLCASFVWQSQVRADAPPVVINEINYHPNTGNESFEFLELYNRTNAPVDVSGWCFTAGISLCFESGKTIAAHGYLVVSPDALTTLIYYQINTDGTYTGNLSNSGESVTLRDATNTIVNKVTYSDSAPWPVSPDGSGPSLELKDPDLDNTLAASWGASLGAPTPNRVNSLVGAPASPELTQLSKTTNVTQTDEPLITVNALGAASVELKYKVQFDADESVSMHDDGTAGDVVAGDHTYSATIPAQAPGMLVRYKVTASNGSTSGIAPNLDQEGINYEGYVVQDPGVTSNLPILQWFISDTDYNDMITNHLHDNMYFNCVIVYKNQVFDNAKVRIKGEYSRSFPKNGLKFNLPKGHTINIPDYTPRPVSEFHMNAEWLDDSKALSKTAWDIAAESGIDVPAVFGTRLQKNGQYYGYFLFLEKYEKEYRDAKGYTGSLYEDFHQKVSPGGGDITEIIDWKDHMNVPRTQARRDYVFDNTNIPNTINFMAFQAVFGNMDWYSENNLFAYKDTHGTNRWSLLPWDLDLIFSYSFTDNPITPYVKPSFADISTRFQSTPLYDEPDLRQMYFRRLRTFADKFYSSGRFLTLYHQNVALSAAEAQLDIAKWGQSSGEAHTASQSAYEYAMARQKKRLLARYRTPYAVPVAQSESAQITINQVKSSVVNGGQFIKLHNPSNLAIDASGWRIDQLNYTLPPGSVIAGNGDAYLPRDDAAFKQDSSGRYVIGELQSDIPPSGTITLLRTDNTQSDTIQYLGS